MADNTVLSSNVGTGDTLKSDDNAGVKTAVSKIELGKNSVFSDTVAVDNPMPMRISDGASFAGDPLVSDFDTGAGTDNTLCFGISVGASGGAVAITGDTTNGLDVDVTRIDPGTGASNLGKAEDSVHTSADVGVMALGVRKDTPANLSGTDGDYEPFQVSAGRLWTSATIDAALPAGTNAIGKLAANSGVDIGDVDVLSIVPGTGATNLGKAEDAAHTSADVGVMSLAVRKDTAAALAGTDGDYAPLEVDANGRLHVLDENTAAIKTAVEVIDNAISGSEMQVDVVAALPAGTNAIGKLAANSGVDIGDVDVTDVVPGTAATNLGKAIDTASGATDTGVAMLAIRDDTLTTLTPVDGDWVGLRVNSTGALHVTGGGGGTEYAVNDAAPADPTGTVSLMERDDALATLSEAEGDFTNPRSNNRGAMWTVHDGTMTVTDDGSFTLAANSGVDIGDVDILSVVPGTGATNLGKAEDAVHATGDVGVMALAVRKATPADLSGADGDYEPLQIDNGRLWTSATIDAALPAGTNAIGKLAANSGVDIGDVDVLSVVPGTGASDLGKAEDAAHTTADVGVMALAVRRDADTTPVTADGDYQSLLTDASGYLKVNVKAGSSGSTQYAEDTAHTTGDTGTMALGVRKDTPANLSGTDGDYEPFQVSAGRLWTSATIDAALPAGTNAIGKLAANSGVDIGDVDILSVVPGTGATNLGKAEDAVHTSADVGVMSLGVRKDTPANLSGTDGDYEPFQVSAGRLWTSATIDAALPAGTNAIGKLAANSGVDIGDVDILSVVPGTGATNLGKAEDSAHTSADVGVMALAVRQDTAAQLAGTDADYSPLITDANGRLHVLDQNTADIKTAVELIDNAISGTEMQVDVVAALPAGTNAIGKLAANDGIDIGDVTINNVSGGGVEASAIRVTIANDSTGLVSVDDNGGSLTVDHENGTASGALGALNDAVTLSGQGTGTINWEIDTGTLVGTVVFEATLDDTNWFAVDAIQVDGTIITSTTSFADRGALTSTGYSQVRLRVSAFTSGTSNARLETSYGANVVRLGDALPAGTNAIGKLSANDGVDIGDVDVTSVTPGTAATNLGKAEDAAHTTGDAGVMALAVRQDTSTQLAGTDGDYTPLVTDANGRLHVLDENSAAIKTAVELIDNAISGTEMQVDVVAALPSGTNAIGKLAANSGVDIGDVDVTSIVPGTGATNLGKAEDAVHTSADVGIMSLGVRKDTPANLSGTDGDYEPFQVSAGRLWTSATIDAALPAGTNAIGKLAANSGVDIGDVDVLSVTPGTGATDLGKAEDAVHATGDVGVMALAVRKATPADLSGADGDYEPLQIDNGRLWTSTTIDAAIPAGTNAIGKLAANDGVDVGDVTINNAAGASAVNIQDGGNTITVDGTVTANAGTGDFLLVVGHTRNEAFKESSAIGGELDDTATTAATEGNVSPARITAQRALHSNLRKNDGTEIASGGGTEADALRVTVANDSTGVVSIDDNGGDISVDWAGTAPPIGAGTEAAALRVTIATDSTGVVSVDDNGSTLSVDGTVTADAGTGTFTTGGEIAHDAADGSSNPVKVGYKAIAHGSNPTAVAADDRTDAYANRHGVPWVIGGHPNVITRSARIEDADGAQTDTAFVTVGAGTKIVVTRITVTSDVATTADPQMRVGFGTATVPAHSHTGANGILLDHPGVPAGGGVTVGDGSGIIGIGADNEDLRYTCDDPVDGNITLTVSYYTIES